MWLSFGGSLLHGTDASTLRPSAALRTRGSPLFLPLIHKLSHEIMLDAERMAKCSVVNLSGFSKG